MTCKQVEARLARAGDGTLDIARRPELDRHLATCPDCRDALESQGAVRRALHERPETPVPLGFATRVMARLDPEPAPGWSTWIDAVNWKVWTFRLAPVAGALLLTAALGLGRADGAIPSSAVDFSELVTAWVAPDDDAGLDTVTVLWTDDDDLLLDVLLTTETGTTF